MIGWLPTASALVVRVATPASRAMVPRVVPSSENVTEPVGSSPVTVAVNVTASPRVEGLSDDVRSVVVLACTTSRSRVPTDGSFCGSPS